MHTRSGAVAAAISRARLWGRARMRTRVRAPSSPKRLTLPLHPDAGGRERAIQVHERLRDDHETICGTDFDACQTFPPREPVLDLEPEREVTVDRVHAVIHRG